MKKIFSNVATLFAILTLSFTLSCEKGSVPKGDHGAEGEENSNTIEVYYSLSDMYSPFHKVEEETLVSVDVGKHDYKRTELKCDGFSEKISAGKKFILKASLSSLSANDKTEPYIAKVRGFIKLTNGRMLYGAFQSIDWSDTLTADISVDIDNINTDGTIKEFGFTFPFIIEKMKFTNLSFHIEDSGNNISNGAYAFPNRSNAYPKHSTPIYLKSSAPQFTQENVEADVQKLFEQWRSRYLKEANFDNPEGKKGKYAAYTGNGVAMPESMKPVTNSECHGWGMLILAHMESTVNNTKSDFDDMVDYYLQWKTDDHILNWQQATALEDTTFNQISWILDVRDSDNDGDKEEYVAAEGDPLSVNKGYLYTTPSMWDSNWEKRCYGGYGGSPEGDFDIAYSLLIADKQWGSEGKHNYKAIAADLIETIKKHYIASLGYSSHVLSATYLQEGNEPDYSSPIYWTTKSSYLFLNHFKAFEEFTGDTIWSKAASRAKDLLEVQYNTPKGLFSDYYVYNKDNGEWSVPTGLVEEKEDDGAYSWNSCTTPLRAYLSLTYDENRSDQSGITYKSVKKYCRFVKNQGGPKDLYTGYTIDGNILNYQDSDGEWIKATDKANISFAAPAFMASLYADDYTESEIEQNYNYIMDDKNLTQGTDEYIAYLGESVRLLSMISYSGNWINP